MLICTFVAGDPKAQPRPRMAYGKGGVRVYSNSAGVGRWKSALERNFRQSAPVQPYTGPLCLELTFYRLGPMSVLHKKKTVPLDKAVVYDESVPDVDNLAKPVMDSLKNAGVIHDDAQVVSLTVRKFKCMHPAYARAGVYVSLCGATGGDTPMPGML